MACFAKTCGWPPHHFFMASQRWRSPSSARGAGSSAPTRGAETRARADGHDGPPRRRGPPIFPHAPDALEGVGVEHRDQAFRPLHAPFQRLGGDVRQIRAVEEDRQPRALADVGDPDRAVLGRVQALAVAHEDVVGRVVVLRVVVELRRARRERGRGPVLARLLVDGVVPAQGHARGAGERGAGEALVAVADAPRHEVRAVRRRLRAGRRLRARRRLSPGRRGPRRLEQRRLRPGRLEHGPRRGAGERGQVAAEADRPVEDVEHGLRAEAPELHQRLGHKLGRNAAHILGRAAFLPSNFCSGAINTSYSSDGRRDLTQPCDDERRLDDDAEHLPGSGVCA